MRFGREVQNGQILCRRRDHPMHEPGFRGFGAGELVKAQTAAIYQPQIGEFDRVFVRLYCSSTPKPDSGHRPPVMCIFKRAHRCAILDGSSVLKLAAQRPPSGQLGRRTRRIKNPQLSAECGFTQARRTGLEPATTGSTVRYSNQLSYRPKICRGRDFQPTTDFAKPQKS